MTSNSEPTKCPECGSTKLLFGKRKALCHECKTQFKKPKGGWRGKNGEPVRVRVFACRGCEKVFAKTSQMKATDDVCPQCGGKDLCLIERW